MRHGILSILIYSQNYSLGNPILPISHVECETNLYINKNDLYKKKAKEEQIFFR